MRPTVQPTIIACHRCGVSFGSYVPLQVDTRTDEETAAWEAERERERYDVFLDHALDAAADHRCTP